MVTQDINKLLGRPRTADYRPTVSGVPSWYGSGMGGKVFDLSSVDLMMLDPTVSLGVGMIEAPIYTSEGQWDIIADSPEIQKYVDESLKRFWKSSLRTALSFVRFGYSGSEVLYRQNDEGLLTFYMLKPLHPRDIVVLQKDGAFAGIRVKRGQHRLDYTLKIFPDLEAAQPGFPGKACWFHYGSSYNFFYGRSRLIAAWAPWRDKTAQDGALDIIRMWYYKNAYTGTRIYHPERDVPDGNGGFQPARDLARQMGEWMKVGASVAMPSTVDPKSGQPYWKIEDPKFNGNADGLMDYLRFLDQQIMRGILIPDNVITEGAGTGSYSGRKVAEDAFYTVEEDILNCVVTGFDDQILSPCVRLNFGPGRKYEIKMRPILPVRQQQQALMQMGQNAPQPNEQQPGEQAAGGNPLAQLLAGQNPGGEPGQDQAVENRVQQVGLSIGDAVGEAIRFAMDETERDDRKARREAGAAKKESKNKAEYKAAMEKFNQENPGWDAGLKPKREPKKAPIVAPPKEAAPPKVESTPPISRAAERMQLIREAAQRRHVQRTGGKVRTGSPANRSVYGDKPAVKHEEGIPYNDNAHYYEGGFHIEPHQTGYLVKAPNGTSLRNFSKEELEKAHHYAQSPEARGDFQDKYHDINPKLSKNELEQGLRDIYEKGARNHAIFTGELRREKESAAGKKHGDEASHSLDTAARATKTGARTLAEKASQFMAQKARLRTSDDDVDDEDVLEAPSNEKDLENQEPGEETIPETVNPLELDKALEPFESKGRKNRADVAEKEGKEANILKYAKAWEAHEENNPQSEKEQDALNRRWRSWLKKNGKPTEPLPYGEKSAGIGGAIENADVEADTKSLGTDWDEFLKQDKITQEKLAKSAIPSETPKAEPDHVTDETAPATAPSPAMPDSGKPAIIGEGHTDTGNTKVTVVDKNGISRKERGVRADEDLERNAKSQEKATQLENKEAVKEVKGEQAEEEKKANQAQPETPVGPPPFEGEELKKAQKLAEKTDAVGGIENLPPAEKAEAKQLVEKGQEQLAAKKQEPAQAAPKTPSNAQEHEEFLRDVIAVMRGQESPGFYSDQQAVKNEVSKRLAGIDQEHLSKAAKTRLRNGAIKDAENEWQTVKKHAVSAATAPKKAEAAQGTLSADDLKEVKQAAAQAQVADGGRTLEQPIPQGPRPEAPKVGAKKTKASAQDKAMGTEKGIKPDEVASEAESPKAEPEQQAQTAKEFRRERARRRRDRQAAEAAGTPEGQKKASTVWESVLKSSGASEKQKKKAQEGADKGINKLKQDEGWSEERILKTIIYAGLSAAILRLVSKHPLASLIGLGLAAWYMHHRSKNQIMTALPADEVDNDDVQKLLNYVGNANGLPRIGFTYGNKPALGHTINAGYDNTLPVKSEQRVHETGPQAEEEPIEAKFDINKLSPEQEQLVKTAGIATLKQLLKVARDHDMGSLANLIQLEIDARSQKKIAHD